MPDLIISTLRGVKTPTLKNGLRTRENLAWAAGLFEGEGSFSYQRRGQYMTIQVELGMTDEDRVKQFYEIVGVGNITGPHCNPKKLHHKGIYRWKVGSFEDVQAVIAMLWLWLGRRRKAKAKKLLQEYHTHKRINRAPESVVSETRRLLAQGLSKRKIAKMIDKSYGFVNHVKRGRTHASAVEVAPQCLIS